MDINKSKHETSIQSLRRRRLRPAVIPPLDGNPFEKSTSPSGQHRRTGRTAVARRLGRTLVLISIPAVLQWAGWQLAMFILSRMDSVEAFAPLGPVRRCGTGRVAAAGGIGAVTSFRRLTLTIDKTLRVRDGESPAKDPDLVSSLLLELGASWTSTSAPYESPQYVVGHFPSSFDLERIVIMLADTLDVDGGDFDYSVDPDGSGDADVETDIGIGENYDWMTHVQKSWPPIIASPFVLTLPWHTDKDVELALGANPEHVDRSYIRIRLQGGAAFGAGEHPTTRLCLSWITDVLATGPGSAGPLCNFLDYGAGSGVLGLAACALDHDVTAVGVEIDADAAAIANVNALTNGKNMKTYIPPFSREHMGDDAMALTLRTTRGRKDGDTAADVAPDVLPERLDKPIYQIAVANILAAPLVGLAPVISRMVAPGGMVGLSGILAGKQADQIIQTYSEFLDDCHVLAEEDGWVLIAGQRKN